MKIKLISTALLLGLSVAVFADPASDKASVNAFYAGMDKNVTAKNFAAVKRAMAPGAKFKTKTGQTVDAKSAMTQAEQQMSMMKSMKLVTTVKSVTVSGNKATVKTHAVMVGVMVEPTSKKTLNIKQIQESVDTLVRGKGGWLLQLSESKSDNTTINGKTMEQFAKEMRDEMAKKKK